MPIVKSKLLKLSAALLVAACGLETTDGPVEQAPTIAPPQEGGSASAPQPY